MHKSYSRCPKCGHDFPQVLPSNEACPVCGIYLFKWEQQTSLAADAAMQEEVIEEDDTGGRYSLTEPLEGLDSASFAGRGVALVFLAVWSYFLIGYDYRIAEINMSFMHNILLPIHEAGHVLFRPFGEFMMIFGGSLLQLALPLGIGIAFIWKYRDNFGAAIGMWWAAASLLDLSPYVYDALHPQLILIGGHTGEDGPHDWIYLLSTLGQLHHAQGWGMVLHAAASILIFASLIWAGAVLWRQSQLLD